MRLRCTRRRTTSSTLRKTSSLVSRSAHTLSEQLMLSFVRVKYRMVKLSISFTHCSFFLFLFSFLDLIQDWASDSAPDIYSFVPYSWKFKILFHQFEMIWAANQHNWIDCSTKQQENGTKDDLPDVNNLRSRKFILNEKFPTLNKKDELFLHRKCIYYD